MREEEVKVKTPCAVIGCALVDEGDGAWWWFAEEQLTNSRSSLKVDHRSLTRIADSREVTYVAVH